MILIIKEKLDNKYCQLIKMELEPKAIEKLTEEYGVEQKNINHLLNQKTKLAPSNINLVMKLIREAIKERKLRFPKDV